MNREKKNNGQRKRRIAFVFTTKEVLGALSLDLFAVLFGGAVAMIPVFAKDILKKGPIGFGWLNAASDIGSILLLSSLLFSPCGQTGKEIVVLPLVVWIVHYHFCPIKNILDLLCRIATERHFRWHQCCGPRHHPPIKNTCAYAWQGDERELHVHQQQQ
jgi:hypothetical protein